MDSQAVNAVLDEDAPVEKKKPAQKGGQSDLKKFMALPVAGEKKAPVKAEDTSEKPVYAKKAPPTQAELESNAMTVKVDMSQWTSEN